MQNKVLKPVSVRHNNYRTILHTIGAKGTCTVTEIASELDLSKTAVFKAVQNLVELGFISSQGKGSSTAVGGKPPENFCINPNARYTCSITCYHDIILLFIHNFLGEEVYQGSFPPPDWMEDLTEDTAIPIYAGWIKQAMELCRLEVSHLCGIMLIVQDKDQTNLVHMASFLKEPQLAKRFQKNLAAELGVGDIVHVERARCLRGYAELSMDDSRKDKLVVVVSVLKEEVSGCILNNGSILRGANDNSADFAHITTDYSMRNTCTCGRKGCFASAVLKDYILRDLTKDLKAGAASSLQENYRRHSLHMGAVVDAAEAGDELAIKYMDYALDNYIRLFSIIYWALNPDEVIFQASPRGQRFHERELNRRFQELNYPTPMVISTSNLEPFKATAIGAAQYCVDLFLDNPDCFQ